MKTYCVKCTKDAGKIDPEISSSSNGKTLMLSKCAICGSKKSRFIKNQEANGLLSGWHWVILCLLGDILL